MTIVRSLVLPLVILLGGVFPGAAQSPVEITGETLSERQKADLRSELLDESEPGSVFEARRQADRAATRLGDYLNSQGYFAAGITPAIVAGPPIIPKLIVEPGRIFTIGTQQISYMDGMPAEDDVLVGLGLSAGQTAIPAEILEAETNLILALRNQGYAFAKADPVTVLGDQEAGTVDLVFNVDRGNLVRFGAVIYEGGASTRRVFSDSLVPFSAGEPYSPAELGLLNKRLGETRLYSVASAHLAERVSGVHESGDDVHDVIVTLTERKRNTIAIGASFSTSEGLGGTTNFSRRNLTRRGDTLEIGATLAEQEQALSADWTLPHLFDYGRSLSFQIEAGRQNTDAFERNGVRIGANLDITRRPNVSYVFGIASETVSETDVTGRRALQTFSGSSAIRFDYSDDLLDPSRGWRADFRVEPGVVLGDDTALFVTTVGQASHYQPLISDGRLLFASRARLGATFASSTLELPTSRRFFAGGGGSARGFGFQDIGPRDADNTPIGGRGLLELTGELRWRQSKQFGFVLFGDAASVVSSSNPSTDDLRVGIGAGIRYYTGFGPIRFDIATPLNPQEGDNAVQVYISIGQAF